MEVKGKSLGEVARESGRGGIIYKCMICNANPTHLIGPTLKKYQYMTGHICKCCERVETSKPLIQATAYWGLKYEPDGTYTLQGFDVYKAKWCMPGVRCYVEYPNGYVVRAKVIRQSMKHYRVNIQEV